MNKAVLVGRLTRDPDLRTTDSGVSSCRFSVAVNRQFKNKSTGEYEADFISCVAWRNTAEFITRYFSKGQMIVVEGTLRTGSYTDKTHPDVTHYTTDVYEDGVTYDKWCRVYLPYGYNPEDTEKKYNVIYFQHGNNGSPNEFFDKVDKKTFGYGVINIFDNLMDPVYGVMEPCIIVCPTYYLYASKETPNLRPDADQSAGDGNYPGIPANYYREVVEDLIPAVEGQLNTWLEDPSEEGIIATREHRLWSGYSRGSVCTWNLFCKDFPFFKYWMPMSAQCVPYSMGDERNTDEAAYEAIKTAVEQNPEYDFFLFTTCGGEADGGMVGQIQYFLKQENGVFSYGLDPEINNFYFTRSAFTHRDEWMPYTLFNARGILFDGTVIRDNSNTAN